MYEPFAFSFSAPLLKCFVLKSFWDIFVVLRWECPAWLGIGAMLGGPALNRKGIEDASLSIGFELLDCGSEGKSIVRGLNRLID
jgi:hypothetical protein